MHSSPSDKVLFSAAHASSILTANLVFLMVVEQV